RHPPHTCRGPCRDPAGATTSSSIRANPFTVRPGQLAGGVTTRHFVQGNDLDLAGIARRTELLVTLQADLLGSFASGFQVFARVELAGVFAHKTTDGAGHGQADVGIDVDLAYAELDGLLDFFHRHTVGFLHVAAELADFSKK